MFYYLFLGLGLVIYYTLYVYHILDVASDVFSQERARAAAMGYEDPTCESVDATTASFHKCLKEILSRVKVNYNRLDLDLMQLQFLVRSQLSVWVMIIFYMCDDKTP